MTAGRQLDLFTGPPATAGRAQTAGEENRSSRDAGTIHPDTPAELRTVALAAVAEWTEHGWLRRLDAALTRFVADASPTAGGPVLLATALVAHLEGQGHTCLVLDDVARHAAGVLRWSGDADEALRRLLATMPSTVDGWVRALSGCDAVHVDAPSDAIGSEPERRGGEPLVLSAGRLYLRRYWRYERRVAADVRHRTAGDDPVDEPLARRWLDRLFGEPAADAVEPDWQKVACAIALRGRLTIVTGGPGTGKTYTAARLLTLLFAMAPEPERLRVALAAPTGKAAARLRQSIDGALATLNAQLGSAQPADALAIDALAARIGPARTLHALLGTRPGTRRFRHDAAHPLDVDIVIVDEASMIHVEMMDALLAALPPTARVLLLGDKDQLASVEAGAVLGELCGDAERGGYRSSTVRYVEAVTGQRIPTALIDAAGTPLAQRTTMLRRSQRFDADIAALANAVNAADADRAMTLLSARPDGVVASIVSASPAAAVDLAVDGRAGSPGGYRHYLEVIRRGPADASIGARDGWIRAVLEAFDRVRVLCAVRDGDWGVEGLNRAVTARLAERCWIVPRGEWYEGRPVIVTRNDAALGVFNGDVGIALRIGVDRPSGASAGDATGDALAAAAGEAALRVCFADSAGVRSIGVGRLGPVETAFAMTVHKSQGSEFDHTVLVLPPETNPVTTRELAYTGVTRARSAFTLVSSRRDALRETLAQSTQRSSGLLGFIDRPEASDERCP